MLGSMICWGSWANMMKLTPGWPFQLFYWDYVAGILLASLAWGLTLGSHGSSGLPFIADLMHTDATHLGYAIAGGVAFNVANLLLVAAIEIAGMAVAFPLGIGVALVVGVILSYLIAPRGNVTLLLGGVLLVIAAIIFDALAYRRRDTVRKKASVHGIQISLLAGVLMGLFYPLVSNAERGPKGLGPYAVSLVFGVGVVLCTLPLNALLMRKPLDGSEPVSMRRYLCARPIWHLWAVLGGGIWASGAIANFVASHAALIGPAVSYAIGQGATMISAVWGVFVWREFADAPQSSRKLLPYMFLFFIAGLVAVAAAPLAGNH
jgi:glucose uptake protein